MLIKIWSDDEEEVASLEDESVSTGEEQDGQQHEHQNAHQHDVDTREEEMTGMSAQTATPDAAANESSANLHTQQQEQQQQSYSALAQEHAQQSVQVAQVALNLAREAIAVAASAATTTYENNHFASSGLRQNAQERYNGSSSVRNCPSQGDSKTYSDAHNNLRLAGDGISVASTAVTRAFDAAHIGSEQAFQAVSRSSMILPTLAPENNELVQTSIVESMMDIAHTATQESLRTSEAIAQASLEASNALIASFGGDNDDDKTRDDAFLASFGDDETRETYRHLAEYVEELSQDDLKVKYALRELAKLLLAVGGLVTNPLDLMAGAKALAHVHAYQRKERISARQLRSVTIPPLSELSSLSRYMRFAASAYGGEFVEGFMTGGGLQHTNSSRSQHNDANDENYSGMSNMDAIMMMTGIDEDDVFVVPASDGRNDDDLLLPPRHFAAVNHNDGEVVVVVQGTLSMHDALVDLNYHNEEFETLFEASAALQAADNSGSDRELHLNLVKGKAHAGFLNSARRLATDLFEPVATALEQHPGYQLVVVGHSLGGAVATLLTLEWSKNTVFLKRNIRAVTFGSPCVLCSNLSQAPFTLQSITSVVLRDDIVSRLSLATFWELQHALIASAPMAECESKRRTLLQECCINRNEEKLYCAGKVCWLKSKEYKPRPIVEVNPIEELNSIELFSNMLDVHLPGMYLDALEKLEKKLHQQQQGS